MSFAPSTRGETECTSASKSAGVGGSSASVSAATPAAATTVTSTSVARSCGSPLHPSRTTVQRVNGGSSPPSPVPRGCSASSCSVVATATSAGETTVAAATPPRPTNPGAAAPPSPVCVALTPHRPNTSATTTNISATASSISGTTSGPQRGTPDATSAEAVLPPLTRALGSRGVMTHDTHVSSLPSRPTSGSSVVLPAVALPHIARGAEEAGEPSREKGKAEQKKDTASCAPPPTETPLPPLTSSTTTVPSPSALQRTAAAASGSPSSPVNTTNGNPGRPNSPTRAAGEPYFRENSIPHLFNELSEALLVARPENPVAFITEWLRRRRNALQ